MFSKWSVKQTDKNHVLIISKLLADAHPISTTSYLFIFGREANIVSLPKIVEWSSHINPTEPMLVTKLQTASHQPKKISCGRLTTKTVP